MALDMAAHRVERIELGNFFDGVTTDGPFSSANLTIRMEGGESFTVSLFAANRSRLRVFCDDIAGDASTMREVEGRA